MIPRLFLSLSLLMPLAPACAETLLIPLGNQAQPALRESLPRLGESQRSVLERFGLPDHEHPAVGQPPITRWDYREFSVYFEYRHVIRSVAHHRPTASQP
ncbi:phosphodiesterase [Pseudomonas fluvialis]|uniref:phosphodiesterase n=1 Tax=Pseudomonas fluvialis TaxID=1793966 RepID=UPI0035AE7CEE